MSNYGPRVQSRPRYFVIRITYTTSPRSILILFTYLLRFLHCYAVRFRDIFVRAVFIFHISQQDTATESVSECITVCAGWSRVRACGPNQNA